ncbi:MAG: methylcobalamin:coenzyme methyltransferase [Bacteroidetes bacterium]|nr:methylcobalamin:coenzyme methyltransferase [Bacteroidota bacterium]
MTLTPRQRFLSYVRDSRSTRQVVSPFLPFPAVIRRCLEYLQIPVVEDDILNEITLSRSLDYEPMFMTDCSGLIFNWSVDPERSTDKSLTRVIRTGRGEWIHRASGENIPWHDAETCPVQTPEDHAMLVAVCEQVGDRAEEIRTYYRTWRKRVGEDGVIVIGHPHPSWLGYQINPSNIFYHWNDYQDVYIRSMEAIFEASLVVMSIAMEEGIDFMSDSSYGLEMTSPELFQVMDLPHIRRFAEWTHDRGGLFWYHNCGFTRQMIQDGTFNTLGADLIETIAPPPEGDNDLAESRRYLDPAICSKGNLNLRILRDGATDEIISATRSIVSAVNGYKHVLSTADGVLEGTPPENYITFVRTARELAGS